MRRAAFAFAAALALLTGPALAGLDQCSEPYGPVLPDAASLTAETLAEAKKEVLQFIADSDAFQSCVVSVMNVKDKDEKLSPAEMAAAQRKIDSNQKEKEAIGNAYNALARDYNARHGAK